MAHDRAQHADSLIAEPRNKESGVSWRLGLTLFVIACSAVGGIGAAGATHRGENGVIAFVSDQDGNSEIYLIAPDGEGRINITDHPADDTHPAWSPDGSHIAFTTSRDGEDAVYLMDGDGASQARLTRGSSPDWSPDGAWIAFEADGSIHAIRPDGTGLHELIASHDPCEGQDPGQCPPGLYSLSYSLPTWSPDGSSIAVVEARVGPTPLATSFSYAIYEASGQGPGDKIASTSEGSWLIAIGRPSLDWSPDGTDIAITVGTQMGPTAWIQPVDDGDAVVLSDPDGAGAWFVQSPAFSPDGSKLLVTGGNDVYIADSDGANPVILADTSVSAGSQPAWQPVRADVPTLFDPDTGRWYLRHVSGSVTSFYFGAPGDHPLFGDWNCDGIKTPGVYREATDTVFLRNRNSTGWPALAFSLGIPGHPIAGDWNGDGCDTIGVFHNGKVSYANWLPSHNATLRVGRVYWFGAPGDWPVAGDFDGDGVTTVAVHRPSTELIYVRNVLTTGPAAFEFVYTRVGDRVLFGDWDGDGRDTVGSFRPQDATFRLNDDNDAGPPIEAIPFGEFDWIVPGTAPGQPIIVTTD